MAWGWVSLWAVNSLHLSALVVPSVVSYNCQDPRTEAGCWMVPNHKSYSKSCRKGDSVPPVSAFGPCWHGRWSTLGPLYCGWSFLDQKVKLLMNVGSIQQKIEFNQWLIYIHSLQGIAEGFFKGTGDEQDVISTFKRLGHSKSRENRSIDIDTVIKCHWLLLTCNKHPGLGPLVRRIPALGVIQHPSIHHFTNQYLIISF